MSNKAYLRLPAIAEKASVAKSTIWLWVRQGRFPAPIKLSPRVTAWRVADVNCWFDDPQAWQAKNGATQ